MWIGWLSVWCAAPTVSLTRVGAHLGELGFMARELQGQGQGEALRKEPTIQALPHDGPEKVKSPTDELNSGDSTVCALSR
jgi:hypothetical protein